MSLINFSFWLGGNLHTSAFTNTHLTHRGDPGGHVYTKNNTRRKTEHSSSLVIIVLEKVLIVWPDNDVNIKNTNGT